MDTRSIDEADEEISFDLLREWISTAFRQSSGEGDPRGCPWISLVQALRHAGAVNGDGAERRVRQCLVDGYMQQSAEGTRKIMKNKLRDNPGLAQIMGGQDVSQALPLWPWYLECLLCCSSEPLEETAVRMPLDMVDLQMIAARLNVAITVSQFMRQVVRLTPPDGNILCSIHLVHHRGLWAPMLPKKPSEKEVLPLLDTVVELDNNLRVTVNVGGQQHDVGNLSTTLGAVIRYDSEQDVYLVSLGVRHVQVERSQIARAIFQTSADGDGNDLSGKATDATWQAPVGCEESALLLNIPDGCLEWQILHELVRRQARTKLEQMMQQLAGRDLVTGTSRTGVTGHTGSFKTFFPVPGVSGGGCGADNPQDGASTLPAETIEEIHHPPGQNMLVMRIPWEVVVGRIASGDQISVFASRNFDALQAGQLPLKVGDGLRILQVSHQLHEDTSFHCGTRWVLGAPQSTCFQSRCCAIPEGWVPCDSLLVWEAQQTFKPDEQWTETRYLHLEAGDTVVLKKRYHDRWAGWGYGIRWEDSQYEGMIHMSYVEPCALVGEWICNL